MRTLVLNSTMDRILFNKPPIITSSSKNVGVPYPILHGGGRGHHGHCNHQRHMIVTPFGHLNPSTSVECDVCGPGIVFPSATAVQQQPGSFLQCPSYPITFGFHEHHGGQEDRRQFISSTPIMVPPGYGNLSVTEFSILQSGIPYYSTTGIFFENQSRFIQHSNYGAVNNMNRVETDQIPSNGNFRKSKPPASNNIIVASESESSKTSSPKRQRHSQASSSVAEESQAGERLWIETRGQPDAIDGLEGERRLIIEFQSFGTKGQLPQTFGRRPVYIPDGLIGKHTAYDEMWKFEIHHTAYLAREDSTVCCLTWRITNVKSGDTVERTETPDEAEARSTLGWTIASKTFREALHRRANQLEASLAEETNSTRLANLKSLIRTLRPKTFTQGPLVFGLKHRIVQERLMLV